MPDDYDYDNVEVEEELPAVPAGKPSFNVHPQVFTPLAGESVKFPCTSSRNRE